MIGKKPIIKICGNQNLENAIMVASFKPDFMGWIFSPRSKRQIFPENAKRYINIIRDKYPEIFHIGVFADNSIENIIKISNFLKEEFKFIQVVEESKFITELRKKIDIEVIPVIRPKDKLNENLFAETFPSPFWIIDKYDDQQKGGTGKSVPLDFFEKKIHFPFLIAGGINKDNFLEYIESTGAIGIDINSGVEESPGMKSYKKLKEFYKIYYKSFIS